jgi:hypothetical protein
MIVGTPQPPPLLQELCTIYATIVHELLKPPVQRDVDAILVIISHNAPHPGAAAVQLAIANAPHSYAIAVDMWDNSQAAVPNLNSSTVLTGELCMVRR